MFGFVVIKFRIEVVFATTMFLVPLNANLIYNFKSAVPLIAIKKRYNLPYECIYYLRIIL